MFHYIQLPSANIDKLKNPCNYVVKHNDDALITILEKNIAKSQYMQNPEGLVPINEIELSPFIA